MFISFVLPEFNCHFISVSSHCLHIAAFALETLDAVVLQVGFSAMAARLRRRLRRRRRRDEREGTEGEEREVAGRGYGAEERR